MSELKAFRIIQGDTGGYGAPSYKCDTDGNRIEEWSDVCEVYDRFEADKVIAHNKFKRCLDMAAYCDLKMSYWAIREIHEGDTGKFDLYSKWHKRWLELAKKLKEAK